MTNVGTLGTVGFASSELRSKWGWFVALGAVMVLLGVLAFANLLIATVATIFYIGALMLIGGVAQIVHAFGVRTWSRFFYWLLTGLIYAIAGGLAFYNPVLASAALTLLFAFMLVAVGAVRTWIGFEARPHQGWGWIVASGIITALAGIIIAVGWPGNSLWVLGLILAIDLIFQGWSFIALGLAFRAGQAEPAAT